MAGADSVEAVLTEIGFGRWQGLVLLTTIVFHSFGPVQQIGSTLLSAPVPFRCSQSDLGQHVNLTNDDPGFGLITTTTTASSIDLPDDGLSSDFPSKCLSAFLPLDIGHASVQPEVSKIKVTKHVTGLPSCPIIEYDTSTFASTVITEWDLVCENSSLRPLFQMAYSIGALLSSLVCGQFSDWLGRKRAIQMGTFLVATTIIATSAVPWYSVTIAMRILTGTGTIFLLLPGYTLLSEISPAQHRTLSPIYMGLTYYGSMSIFAAIAYLVPHWRKLFMFCNAPLVILIPLVFFIDESPRWLLQKGRTAEAVQLLRKAATQNGVTFSTSSSSLLDKLDQMSQDTVEKKIGHNDGDAAEKQGTLRMLWTCFSSPGMRTVLIVTSLLCFLQRSLYVGIVLNANNFTSSNPFEYVAILGAMGVVAMILSIPLSIYLPRRIYIGTTLFIGGTLFLLELSVPSAYWWAKWIMVMVSFCLVCGSLQVNVIFSAELFPTVIRTQGFTFSNLMGSIGEMTIPLVIDIAVQYQWWAPNVTFGLSGIISSFLLTLLPETKDRPMPESLQDVEDRFWNDYRGFGQEIIVEKDTIIAKRKPTTFQV